MASGIRIGQQDGGLHVACGIAYAVRRSRFEPTAFGKPCAHTDVGVDRKGGEFNVRQHCIANRLLNMILNSETYFKKWVKCTVVQALRLCTGRTVHRGSRGIGKGKVHRCTGTEALYRPYSP